MLEKFIADWRSQRLTSGQPSWARLVVDCLGDFKLRILLRMRLSQVLIQRGFVARQLARHLHKLNCRYAVDISPFASIEGGLRLAHPQGIVLGDRVVIGRNVRILHGVTLGGAVGKVRPGDPTFTMPRIDDFAVIGPGANICGPIRVGRGALVAANSVILKDVDELTQVGGVPGRVLATFTRETVFPAHYEQMVSVEELFDEKSC